MAEQVHVVFVDEASPWVEKPSWRPLSAHRTPEGASRALSARRGGGDSEIADAMRPREKITSIPLLD